MAFNFEPLETIGTIEKNSREKIVIRTCKINSAARIDCRIHFESVATEQLTPTGKGLNLSHSQAGQLRDLLTEAMAHLEALDDKPNAPEDDPELAEALKHNAYATG